MKKNLYIICAIVLMSCNGNVKIEGFDQEIWDQPFEDCNQSKLEQAKVIVANQDQLLSKGQATIKAVLGQPNEHELYNRNQKFFYYYLQKSHQDCEERNSTSMLAIKFDALDRAKEIRIIY